VLTPTALHSHSVNLQRNIMAVSPPPIKIKYLTNKELLEEIHRSKTSYCSYLDPTHAKYDFIVSSKAAITETRINDARKKKLLELQTLEKKEQIGRGVKDFKSKISIDDIPIESIVIRVMTHDHIPLNPDKIDKAKTESERHIRCNFPPFQHFILRNNQLECVLKSHWKDGLENGYFCKEHGKMTNNLALMFMKLVERYGHRGNWRGYCIADGDEALTQRGWLGMNDINESDIILSYSNGNLTWSKIKSIYRGEYDGLMHKITNHITDMLVTPGHKLVTDNGLIPVEYLTDDNNVILMGNPVDNNVMLYDDAFVELAGWIVTEGNYEFSANGELRCIYIWQKSEKKTDRIRRCLNDLEYRFSETIAENNTCFAICREHSQEFQKTLMSKDLTMEFIVNLSADQKNLLIDTIVNSDSCRGSRARKYIQQKKEHINVFQALCALAGHRTTHHLCKDYSYGELREFYRVSVLSPIKNKVKVSSLNFHGGKRHGRGLKNKDKISHPNQPTTQYNGMVWCPETEYGCFVVRRNGKVYLTGNTYIEEMKSQALLQLSQVGLQFDESRSEQPNPFSYYTQTITNSFMRILNIEKKNQNIRDDILIMHGSTPSWTRMVDNELAQKKEP